MSVGLRDGNSMARFTTVLRELRDGTPSDYLDATIRRSKVESSQTMSSKSCGVLGKEEEIMWTGRQVHPYAHLEELALCEDEWTASEVAQAESSGIGQSSQRRSGETAKEPQEAISSADLVEWILELCSQERFQGSWRPEDLANVVLSLLNGESSDAEIQGELFEILDDFDSVASLLSRRQSIRERQADISAALRPQQRQRQRGTGRPAFIQPAFQVVNNTRNRLQEENMLLGYRGEEMDVRESAMAEALRHATESSSLVGRLALPKELRREVKDGYEEYFMPPLSKPRSREVQLEQVKNILPENLLPAFSGVTTLNPIQSTVWKIALRSSENMLICAPTGAGKTNIALLTILREISRFVDKDGMPMKQGWRVVYVAPMKALAAEVVEKFSEKLSPLGLKVRELTGDTSLTRAEAMDTQVVVVTPEKWDVVTRKAGGEGGSAIADSISLLIIDEIHLLHEDRGSVLESLVARTQRRAESEQRMIRLVGLSATLPNYRDVAGFLGVGDSGLFFFDASFRPVPLSQTFIGVEEKNRQKRNERYLDIAVDKLKVSLRNDHQCMVFVHSRKDTLNTANDMLERGLFEDREESAGSEDDMIPTWAVKEIEKFRATELRNLTLKGVGIHHAGMLRADRRLVEKLFLDGILKVLVCTATLAWGVNLPAHTVIIKGTQIYDAKRGGFVELSMLDVMQIFGRAGRPQFDSFGEGIILTGSTELTRYLKLMTASLPIESTLRDGGLLPDHLNAEIVLGTVSSIAEAVKWVGYTYLAVRMKRNPLHYGCPWDEVVRDPELIHFSRGMVIEAAKILNANGMIRFDERSEELAPTELGRIASHFYVSHATISEWNGILSSESKDSDTLLAVASASEFEQVRPREEEMEELTGIIHRACPIAVKSGLDSYTGKVVALLQAYISRYPVKAFSLVSDMNYVAQSASRLMRALVEISLRKGWPGMALTALELSRSIDRRLWAFEHPLSQLADDRRSPAYVPAETCRLLQRTGQAGDVESLVEMTYAELINLVRSARAAAQVRRGVRCIPALFVDAHVVPVTRSVLRITVKLWPGFTWLDPVHGRGAEAWRLWVEDTQFDRIYHVERITLSRRQCKDLSELSPLEMVLTVPVFDPPSSHYVVSVESERWHGAGTAVTLSLEGLVLPNQRAPHTDLLDLRPLPKTALGTDEPVLSLYKFKFFNALQTQMFWTLYHSDENVLVGAPTGSGKTVTAELAALRAFRTRPKDLVVYVAPLKALVRERVRDWSKRLCGALGKKLVELTGDTRASTKELDSADVVVTTPEKWDGVTRGWRHRSYVRRASLLILDEVHLLGSERGAVLEVIVSRTRRIGEPVRFVALSTALANPGELADWLGVNPTVGLFNFRPSVRPVPCEVHIQGIAGEHYCPRMIAMNRPTYAAILRYSPNKPALVFVSSRRQTRLTALDLVRFAAADGSPRRFVAPDDPASLEIENILPAIRDETLRQTLEFGVGMHHAGLAESDRVIAERLFGEGKIRVLISTSTLAWGVNLPAHLVVLKGTEFFDAKQHRYVDMPLTDILQMIGRAGRPQFDDRAYAVVLVHEPKKGFYKKFLYEAFPVESSLPGQLADHINAEIAGGTIRSAQDALDYLTWTYFFRRLLMNPAYYGLEQPSATAVSVHLSKMIESILRQLMVSGCIEIHEPESLLAEAHKPRRLEPTIATQHADLARELHTANPTRSSGASEQEYKPLLVAPLPLGHIAAYYYLSHKSMELCSKRLTRTATEGVLLQLLADCEEFSEVPVRHNENKLCEQLWHSLRNNLKQRGAPYEQILPAEGRVEPDWFSPHVKTFLLLIAHISRFPLPSIDFGTNMVQDNMSRVIMGIIDVAAENGMMQTTMRSINLSQQLNHCGWSAEGFIPLISSDGLENSTQLGTVFRRNGIQSLPQLLFHSEKSLRRVMASAGCTKTRVNQVLQYRKQISLPRLSARWGKSRSKIEISIRRTEAESRTVILASWYFLLGQPETDELHAIKRITALGAREELSSEIILPISLALDREVVLYAMSDSFIGIDQQVEIREAKSEA